MRPRLGLQPLYPPAVLSRLRLGSLVGRGIGLYPPDGDATEDSIPCIVASAYPVGSVR